LKIEKLIIKLQKELEFIKDDVEGILLYGSCASDTGDLRSDIDICIVKPRKNCILSRWQ
jgi:predicted nucleotidyltransferase